MRATTTLLRSAAARVLFFPALQRAPFYLFQPKNQHTTPFRTLVVPPMAAARAPAPAPDRSSEFYKKRVIAVIEVLRREGTDSKTLGEAQYQLLIIVEDARRSANAPLSSNIIADVKAHFSKAKEHLLQGGGMVEVLDELEAAIIPILERLETQIAGLKEEVVGLKQKIDDQQKVIGSVVQRQADMDALLDLRQISSLMQLEVTQDFLHLPKKFGDLSQSQRAQLIREAKSIFQIPDRFGVDGGNFVHRRKISASKIKAYILKEFGEEFSEQDVDAFLEYLNRLLKRQQGAAVDLFTQEVTIGTFDKGK